MVVKKGDKVKVEYTGSLEDGTVFDSSDNHDAPLEFEVGSGQIIKGFDEAVVGMEKGEDKEVTLGPKDAYGEPNPDLVKKVPRDKLPADQEIKPGMMLGLGMPDGRQVPAIITAVDEKELTIDMNPPLAGKELTFKITLVEYE